jgi:alkanesulfonate monooxygenase SsuD/methylene tetrahydromethanopterin reductase-like flavin-dependent oxidoreductase (luciferase family)
VSVSATDPAVSESATVRIAARVVEQHEVWTPLGPSPSSVRALYQDVRAGFASAGREEAGSVVGEPRPQTQ